MMDQNGSDFMDAATGSNLSEFAGRTLLVTGGSGFLGKTVMRHLVSRFPGKIMMVHRGQPVSGAVPLPAPHVAVRSDLRDGGAWHGLLREVDYVLWMAALRDHNASATRAHAENVGPLRAAVDALTDAPRLRRFVFTSSISVLDQPPHLARPRVMDDDAVPHPSTHYGNSKLDSEQVLRASGLPCTVLRLPFLYGPDFRRHSFLDFYRRVATSPALSIIRFTANLSLLYTGDVASLVLDVLASAHARQANASPYVVSDGHTYEVDELITLVARLHGRERPRVRLPAGLSRSLSAAMLWSRTWARPGPVRRGTAGLLVDYWSHAAFTRDYFVVDSSRFRAAFPSAVFTPVELAMARTFASEPPANAPAADGHLGSGPSRSR